MEKAAMSNTQDASRGTQPGAEPGHESQLKRLNDLVDRIGQTKAGGRIIRLLIFLLLAVVVLGVGVRVYASYRFIQNNAPMYQAAFTEEMGRFLPGAAEDLQSMLRRVAPKFQDALHDDWQRHGESVLKKFEQEGEVFVNSAEKALRARLEKDLNDLIKKYDAQFEEAFPQLKEPKSRDRVLDSLRHAVTISTVNLVEKHMVSTLGLMGQILDETVKFLPDKGSQDKLLDALSRLFDPVEKSLRKRTGSPAKE